MRSRSGNAGTDKFLERENEILETQISQNNQSLNSYASQLDFYRERVYELENNLQACPRYGRLCQSSGTAVFEH